VRRTDQRGIYIDDEDEWDEHRVEYGYPLHVVNRLEAVTQDLKRKVTDRVAPFNEATTRPWFDVLAALDL
jgi:protein associated with RNAse G/E